MLKNHNPLPIYLKAVETTSSGGDKVASGDITTHGIGISNNAEAGGFMTG